MNQQQHVGNEGKTDILKHIEIVPENVSIPWMIESDAQEAVCFVLSSPTGC
jgi:hypothetical protein